MIRGVLWFVQIVLVVPAVYSSVVALWGLRSRRPRPAGAPCPLRVVVAAHDEAAVIAGIAADLGSQTLADSLLDVCVIADRCTDDTAEIARRWVPVVERPDGQGAKGAAIAWYLDQFPLGEDESLLIIDADNRIAQDFCEAVATELGSGATVVQTYLDVGNPDGSALATANALTYWASNRMVQLARTNLGWSCDLGGTGMALTRAALADAGGFSDDLAEDLSLNVRLNLAGHRAEWLHDIRVMDEKPTGTGSTVTQRARWVRGKRAVQRTYGPRLVGEAIRQRQLALFDLAYRLYNPGRSFIALAIGILAVAAAIWPGAGLWPWWLLAAIGGVVVLLPLVFLAADGVRVRYLIRYPYVTLIAMLWLPIRIASRLIPNWRRTAHTGG